MNSIWNLVKITQSNTYWNVIVCGFWVKLDITSLHRQFFKHLFWVRRKFLSISFFFFSFGHPLEYVTSLSKCLLLVFVSICFCDHVPHCKRIEKKAFFPDARKWVVSQNYCTMFFSFNLILCLNTVKIQAGQNYKSLRPGSNLIPVEQILKKFRSSFKVLEYGIHYRTTSKMPRLSVYSSV